MFNIASRNTEMKLETIIGNMEITGAFEAGWNVTYQQESPEEGLEFIRIKWDAESELPPPETIIRWSVPQYDMQNCWTASSYFKNIPPDWGSQRNSNLACSAPVMAFFNNPGENRMTFAFSEAKRPVQMAGGVREEDNEITCYVKIFHIPEAPIRHCEAVLRIDIRDIFYADAIRSVTDWFASFPEYKPSVPPEAAFEPIYSTWYSYHQSVFGSELEDECRLAKEYGMKGIIVDDGWQTDDTSRGYAFCGDWEVSKKRLPDMKAHVAKVHELGMKYLIWYSVPFVGYHSKAYETFKGKYLRDIPSLKAVVFDPRFPDVREYLINTYENAVREWDLDGLKLDFIDAFVWDDTDPAVKDNYAGRDIKSVPEACDVLLSQVMTRLKALKPDILIEFRQSYIGPAIRKYGNMFRAGDCPADALSNRVRTMDLRLTSGNTAVHSDMLEWNTGDSPDVAALQLLSVLFTVPQISVRMAELPYLHQQWLKFYLNFCVEHRKTLLHGYLKPMHPELNYPVISAETEEEKIIAVYGPGQVCNIDCKPGTACYVVNASGTDHVILNLAEQPGSAELYEVIGEKIPSEKIQAGLSEVFIPVSGLLKLQF